MQRLATRFALSSGFLCNRTLRQATQTIMNSASLSSAAETHKAQGKKKVRGVVFDMDGTLTVPCIDFGLMRSKLGLPPTGGDILDIISTWEPDRQKWAHDTLAEIERQALEKLKVMPGVQELCRYLDSNRIPRAIVTRNVSASIDYFHNVAWSEQPFRPALSREFRPYKPNPAAILHICEEWGISPTECVMVGDSARDDVVSGNRAGALTILFDSYQRHRNGEDLEGDRKPTYKADTMQEVLEIFRREFVLEGSEQQERLGAGKEGEARPQSSTVG